jgi:hypothetical protein
MLVEMYDRERAATGCGHLAALLALARRLGVDEGTVRRTLGRSGDKRFLATTDRRRQQK